MSKFNPFEPSASDETWSSAQHRFAVDHPTRDGHFPGDAIIPGATLLDCALRAMSSHACEIASFQVEVAKFLKPVRPGDAVLFEWRTLGDARIMLQCSLLERGTVALTASLRMSI